MSLYINDTVDYPFQMRSTVVVVDYLGVPPLYGEGDEDDEEYFI